MSNQNGLPLYFVDGRTGGLTQPRIKSSYGMVPRVSEPPVPPNQSALPPQQSPDKRAGISNRKLDDPLISHSRRAPPRFVGI
jgi:hypothetical protein